MSFPNPPAPNQEYPHPNGITYIYNADQKTWDIKYEQAMNTGSLSLISPSNRYELPAAGASLPDSSGLITQSDYNTWAFNSLVKVDATSRVDEGEDPPVDADTNTLWYKPSTGSMYIYYNDGNSSQWVEVSGSSSELQDLESVLTEGPIADKGMLLTDGSDALVAIAPDEALIDIASDTSKKNPSIRLTHIDKLNYPDSQAQIELDQDGTRVDFEFYQAINDVHFRFDDQEKLVLNKEGDAEFTGRVKVTPGITGNEVATLGQVLGYVEGLQAEINQLTDSKEMGEWTFDDGDDIADQGEYIIRHVQTQEEYDKTIENLQQGLNDCLAANQGNPSGMSDCQRDYDAAVALVPAVGEKFTTNDWNQGEEIEFSFLDANGATHTFNTVKTGQYIDMVNEDGTGFMLGEITRVVDGMWYENPLVYYSVVKSFGTAQGKVRVRIFSVTDGITGDDLTNFVRKDGDTMTGSLAIDQNLTVNNRSDFHEKVRINLDPEDGGGSSFIIYGKVNNTDGELLLRSTFHDKHSSTNDKIEYHGTSDTDASLVNAKWVTDAINTAVDNGALADEYLPTTGGVLTGNLVLDTGSGLYTKEIIKSTRETGYAFQVKPADSNAAAFIHTNGNAEFAHVKVRDTPTDDSDLTTKEYVDAAVTASNLPTPCRWMWTYKGSVTDEKKANLESGTFIGPSLGNGGSSYGYKYFFHVKPKNSSYTIGQIGYDEEMSFVDSDGAPLLSIWVVVDNKVKLQCVQRIRKFTIHKQKSSGGRDYMECEIHIANGANHHFASSGHFTNTDYFVQLSGIF